MKHSVLKSLALGCAAVGLMSVPALANNATVENALKSRPDLSMFYQGLVSTGVIGELKENQSYTVFAPTNEAFAKLSPDKYPCFYSASCKAEAAQILRNHIVPGEKHVQDIFDNKGGLMSLFTIDDHHLIISEPYKNDYTVNGQNILSTNQLLGGVLYTVDGVVASPREMAQFMTSDVAIVRVPGTDLPPRVPAGTIVTVTTTSN